MTRFKRQCK